jgi:hypothetical protein
VPVTHHSSPEPIKLLLQQCDLICQVLLSQRSPGSRGNFEIHATTASNTFILKLVPCYCYESSSFHIDLNDCSRWMRPASKKTYSEPLAMLVEIEYNLHCIYSKPGHGIIEVNTECIIPGKIYEVSVDCKPSHRNRNQIVI